MRKIRLTLLLAAVSWLQLSPAAAGSPATHERATLAGHQGDHSHPTSGEQVLKVGKTGEVTFNNETRVGDLTLRPGRYKFQHRVEGADHFVHFTEVTKDNPYGRLGGGVPKAHPGEVKCALEPLNKKVSQTSVYSTRENGAWRVTRVEVRGENAAHVLPSGVPAE